MPKEIRIPIYSLTTELAKNMSVVHVFEDWAPQKDFIIPYCIQLDMGVFQRGESLKG
jgi:hypothetical protein